MGLWEFSSHLAVYPPGSFYKRHKDNFIGAAFRKITCILYLNQNWKPEDGGQLRLFLEKKNPDVFKDISPSLGKLVVFLSEEFEHEVLKSNCDRFSITGWFSVRPV